MPATPASSSATTTAFFARCRPSAGFARQGVLRVLPPMRLAGHGAVSTYWRDGSKSRTAVALALDHLRVCAREGPDAADDPDADAPG